MYCSPRGGPDPKHARKGLTWGRADVKGDRENKSETSSQQMGFSEKARLEGASASSAKYKEGSEVKGGGSFLWPSGGSR